MNNENQSFFAQAFADCLAESCGRVPPERAETLEDCRELCETLYRKLEEKAGYPLTDEFGAAKNALASLREKEVYRQGFWDCADLLRWLKLL